MLEALREAWLVSATKLVKPKSAYILEARQLLAYVIPDEGTLMASQISTDLSYDEFKKRVFLVLNDPSHASLVGRVFSVGLMVLIIVNAILILVSFNNGLSAAGRDAIFIFDAACTFIFLVEYIARIWTADLYYPSLSPVRSRLRYVFSLMGIIDFLAIGPSIILILGIAPNQTVNALRVLRVIRLVKLSRYIKGLSMISHVFMSRKQEIIPAFAVLLVLTITASVLMYQFENPVQPEKFDSIFAGVYWAVTTITSTGYGDLFPITFEGRVVGVLTMLCSIGIVAIPTGIISAGFVEEARIERIRKAKQKNEKKRNHRNWAQEKRDKEVFLLQERMRKTIAEESLAYSQNHTNKSEIFSGDQSSDHQKIADKSDFKYCPYCGKRLP